MKMKTILFAMFERYDCAKCSSVYYRDILQHPHKWGLSPNANVVQRFKPHTTLLSCPLYWPLNGINAFETTRK